MTTPHLPVARQHSQPRSRPIGQIKSSPTFIKRRTLVYTGAVAVIIIAGSILGSQLKSMKQVKERREAKLALDAETLQNTSLESDTELSGNSSVLNTGKISTARLAPAGPPPPSDLSKQIAFLEERRGRLMGQKMSLEQKLASVLEKMKRDKELDAGRRSVNQTK
jgi:hypothetical protein